MEQLIKQIEQWASDRNIIKGSKPIDQAMKLFSEFGELADNVGKGRDCRDDIGDVFVVLVIISKQLGLSMNDAFDYAGISAGSLKHAVCGLGATLHEFAEYQDQEKLINCIEFLECTANEARVIFQECVQIAYNDIKDRKGILWNGTFVKNTDENYNDILRMYQDSMEENYSA